jgi:multidrug efflux system outer membrane protein
MRAELGFVKLGIVPGLCLMAVACVQVPPKTPEPALRQSAPVLADAGAGAVQSWPDAAWWRRYDDPTLDELVERALKDSPTLATAMARVEQARASVRQLDQASGVQLDGSAAWERQRLSENGFFPTKLLGITWYNQADLDIQGSYRFDWWGKQRLAIRSATNSARATLLEAEAVRLTLSASVTDAYFGWQSDVARLALAEQKLQLLAKSHDIVAERVQAGLAPVDDLHQMELQTSAANEQRALLKNSAELRRVVLAALLGCDPDQLPTLTARALPAVQAGIPDGISLDLAAHRPDVQASYWSVRASVDNLDAVRAGYYPDVSLHALAGLSSIHMGKLFEGASANPNFGAAVHLPIFNLGQLQADRQSGRARLADSVAAYNSAVVDAARELNTAAVSREQLRQQLAARSASLVLTNQQQDLASERLNAKLTNALPVLQSQLQQLDAQDAVLQLDAQLLANDINLTRALGGGYALKTEPQP